MIFPLLKHRIKTFIFIFIFFKSLLLNVQALNCYICAEAGLEEFGECKTSFPFSCDGYAKRFPNGEKIFCRTTRHKTANGTFTVVKECIADSAHHATFPRKPYEYADECDVLDLNGVEVAYCLCGGEHLCNGAPIVDQFSAFEEKYPELFDPEPTVASSDQWPLSSQQQQRSAEDGEEVGEEANTRPADQQQRERNEEEGTESVEEQMVSTSHRPTVDESVHFGTLESSAGQTPPSVGQNANPFVAPPARNSEEKREYVTIPLPIKTTDDETQQTTTSADFQCFQCKESKLENGRDDCASQMVVNCGDPSKTVPAIGRPLCLSRQTVDIKTGHVSVQKECVSERAILNELGAKAVPMLNGLISEEISCGQQRKSGEETNGRGGGRTEQQQNICICATAQCNGKSVGEQMQLANGHHSFLATYTPSTVPTPTPFEMQKPIKSMPNLATVNEPLNCDVCLDVELGNAQTDCRNANSQNCGHQIRDEKAYCLTRQTQNGKDAFIVEKSCVTKRQFYQQFPEELQKHSPDEVPIGCDATYDGFVNYCLCDGQMCNRNPLSVQAENYGKSIGKMGNKSQIGTNKKPHSGANSAEEGPSAAVGTTEMMPKISMRPTQTSSPELVHQQGQEEKSGQPLDDEPSVPSWSVPSWSTVSAPPNSQSVPTTAAPSTLTQNDRFQKWKQNSERAKRPSFQSDGDELSFAQRALFSEALHTLAALLASSLLLMMMH